MSQPDPQPPHRHGTRAGYRAGCRSTCCKAAEATYRAQLRRDRAKGILRLGQRVSAQEAWKRIRQLKPEFGTYGMIAHRLGYKAGIVQFGQSAITVRNLLKVRRLYRLAHLDGEAQ